MIETEEDIILKAQNLTKIYDKKKKEALKDFQMALTK